VSAAYEVRKVSIAVHLVDFHPDVLAFDQPLEIGLGFWTIGLTREC
jgi:hypothetical protein